MRKFAIISCVAIAVAFTYSCKKKKDTPDPVPEPVVNCDLAAEKTSGYGGHVVYEYDADNRLVKETINGALAATFEYKDGGKTIVETATDKIITYTLNNEGRAIKIVESTNTGNLYVRTYTYVNGYLAKIVTETSYNGGVPTVTTTNVVIGYANSNVTSQVYKDSAGTVMTTVTSTHNLTRLNNLPDARPFLPDAVTTAPHDKNLLVTRHVVSSTNDAMIYFTYQFDSKNRVSQMILKGVNSSSTNYDTTDYKYRCD